MAEKAFRDLLCLSFFDFFVYVIIQVGEGFFCVCGMGWKGV